MFWLAVTFFVAVLLSIYGVPLARRAGLVAQLVQLDAHLDQALTADRVARERRDDAVRGRHAYLFHDGAGRLFLA